MSIRKVVYAICFIFLILIGFWYFYLRNAKENRLKKEGAEVVRLVEKYRQEKNKLLYSISELGLIDDDNTELYLQYKKIDSINYYVWVGLSSEQSIFYYSDSKRWENSFREIKR